MQRLVGSKEPVLPRSIKTRVVLRKPWERLVNFPLIEHKIGFSFGNKRLLLEALTHRSSLNETPQCLQFLCHNERLEWIGDLLLGRIVGLFLFHKFPEATEGQLTEFQSCLVCADSLTKVARKLNLQAHILLSRGERKCEERTLNHILASTFEALVAAIYFDKGDGAAERFVRQHLLSSVEELIPKRWDRDPKSVLQEICQDIFGITPSYKVLQEEGKDHCKTFTVGVFAQLDLLGKGSGPNHKLAEMEAARDALLNYPTIKNRVDFHETIAQSSNLKKLRNRNPVKDHSFDKGGEQ